MTARFLEDISQKEAEQIALSLIQTPDLFGQVECKPFVPFYTDWSEEKCVDLVTVFSGNQPFGKKMEGVVECYFQQCQRFDLVAKGVQVINGKTTLGELDFLVRQNQIIYHIELATKFYLYDASLSENPTENWIGPNRKDFLYLKMDKLANGQLPLLHEGATQAKLRELLPLDDVSAIEQRVIFKANLFVPLHHWDRKITEVNHKCLVGVYASVDEIPKQFADWEFTVPAKLFWLCEPGAIDRFEYAEMTCFSTVLTFIAQEKSSQLIWLKKGKQYLRVFATYW